MLQVTNCYYPELQFGGPPQKIHALSRGLVKRGHDVRVVTFHSERPHASERKTIDGVEVQYLPWVGRGLRQYPRGWSALSAAVYEADVVHVYGLYNMLCPLAAFLARKKARPFLLEPLGMYPERVRNVPPKKLFNRLFTRPMARRCAVLIATSPGEVEQLRILASKERLVLRRNGVDVSAFAHLP